MWFYDFGSGSGWDYLNQKNKESSTSTTQPIYSSCSRAMVHWQFILLLLMLFSSATFSSYICVMNTNIIAIFDMLYTVNVL